MKGTERRNWAREELILAFNLYCQIPYGTFHGRNPRIIELAGIMGRTPNALALKLSNFASFDPYHKARGIKGLQNTGKLDKEIWDEFTNNWGESIYESEKILAVKQKTSIEKKYGFDFDDIGIRKGENRTREIKARVNQTFFRNVVLSIYNFRCAISGIDIPDLLIASHIIPWAVNEKERLNPRNGLCLSPLYDRCFDQGYVTITADYKFKVARELRDRLGKDCYSQHFHCYDDGPITLPDRFLPDPDFLEYHYRNVFRG
jgi:putative restriction endonuclease